MRRHRLTGGHRHLVECQGLPLDLDLGLGQPTCRPDIPDRIRQVECEGQHFMSLGFRLYHVCWNISCDCGNVEEHVNGSRKAVLLLRRFIAVQLFERNNLEYEIFTLLWVIFSSSYLMKGAFTYDMQSYCTFQKEHCSVFSDLFTALGFGNGRTGESVQKK